MKTSEFELTHEKIAKLALINEIESRDSYDGLTDEEVRLLIRRKVDNALAQYSGELLSAKLKIRMLEQQKTIEDELEAAQKRLADLLNIELEFETVESE